jgi:molybdopterin synthase catalytic subunit
MRVRLSEGTFDPWQELAGFRSRHGLDRGKAGAASVFVGTMRDFNDGQGVERMFLEHYPGMTERSLEAIVESTLRDCGALEAFVIHRVGDIAPGEDIVLVAAFATHRAEAFTACRAIMEALKRDAPFWKRESTPAGDRWVSGNTPGSLDA